MKTLEWIDIVDYQALKKHFQLSTAGVRWWKWVNDLFFFPLNEKYPFEHSEQSKCLADKHLFCAFIPSARNTYCLLLQSRNIWESKSVVIVYFLIDNHHSIAKDFLEKPIVDQKSSHLFFYWYFVIGQCSRRQNIWQWLSIDSSNFSLHLRHCVSLSLRLISHISSNDKKKFVAFVVVLYLDSLQIYIRRMSAIHRIISWCHNWNTRGTSKRQRRERERAREKKRKKENESWQQSIDGQLVPLNTYREFGFCFSIMDSNRSKTEPQQQRRSIVEGMARTGIRTFSLFLDKDISGY